MRNLETLRKKFLREKTCFLLQMVVKWTSRCGHSSSVEYELPKSMFYRIGQNREASGNGAFRILSFPDSGKVAPYLHLIAEK